MATLERAIEIAARAHAGQLDKSGEPYISHPLRVALGFISSGNDRRAIIAVLHDVVEDSDVTIDDLAREGFAAEIVAAVAALTRADDEDYADYIRRVAADQLARSVKIADIQDNLDRTRMARLDQAQKQKMAAKYHAALAELGGAGGA